jgi:hypothetical protein
MSESVHSSRRWRAGGITGPYEVGGDPTQRGIGLDAHALGRWSAAVEVGADVVGDVATVERGDICRVDRMQQVTHCEYARPAGTQRRVDDRAQRAGIYVESSGACQLVVGDPVPGENDSDSASVKLAGTTDTGWLGDSN